MNLGAGAETGIYEYYSDTHWLTATDKATDMELTLYHNGEKLYSYSPYGDENPTHRSQPSPHCSSHALRLPSASRQLAPRA